MASIWEAARETVAEIETVIRGLGYEPCCVTATPEIARVSFDAGRYSHGIQIAFGAWEALAGFREPRVIGSLEEAGAWLAQVMADGMIVEEAPEGGWRAQRLGYGQTEVYPAPTREAAIAAALTAIAQDTP